LATVEAGLVVRDQSGFYWVESESGDTVVCRLRGRLKEAAQSANIATIGDRVTFLRSAATGDEPPTGVIETVAERQSTLSRAVRTTGKWGAGQAEREQVLIANADQACFVFAAASPSPDLRILDRLLVAGERAGIPHLRILVNKIDLLESTADALAPFAPYAAIGYDVRPVSAQRGDGIAELRSLLTDQISVFAGPSGVGKTSLLNAIQPGLARAVKGVGSTGEGQHTTRDSALVRLAGGGYLADTPGIRGLLVWNVEPAELDAYFIEIGPCAGACRFSDCGHQDEPGCAVRAALEAGMISPVRYKHYLELKEELRDTYITY
jgi:ribosome biogenesis GTPase / thiamine phosphate phosphatase